MDASNDERWLKAWLAIVILGGHGGIPLLLITLYLSSLRRVATLYSLLWSCIVWAIIDLLLYYPGRIMPTDPKPSYALCLTQASLRLSQPILTSWCSLALVYDCWVVISGNSKGPEHPTTIRRTVILIAVPWFAFVLTTGGSLLVGANAPVDLGRERHFFFCTYRNSIWSDFTAALAGIALATSFYFTAKGVILWRNYRKNNAVGLVKHTDDRKMALCIISISGSWRTRMNDLLVACLPLAVLIIFVTQRDVLNVYVSCAKAVSKTLLHPFNFTSNKSLKQCRSLDSLTPLRTANKEVV